MQKENTDRWTGDSTDFQTLKLKKEGAVLFAEIDAPPMNLMGPQLVGDLVSLIQIAESDAAVQVIVFKSADPDYFISHVDVTSVKENREAAMKLNGEASLGLLFYHLSRSRLVSIAQIEGRVRGVGSEFILACDMRFAAIESAIFGQFEASFGVVPGAGAVQHLGRLLGRGRALEVLLSTENYNATIAERYGWINRALPTADLSNFVASLAHRIALFPANGRTIIKERINTIGLPPVEELRRDSTLFLQAVGNREYQDLMQAAMKQGFQTREGEMHLAQMLGDVARNVSNGKHQMD